jgi:hypothetical protein
MSLRRFIIKKGKVYWRKKKREREGERGRKLKAVWRERKRERESFVLEERERVREREKGKVFTGE